MRNIDRLLLVKFSWWMLKSVRQLRRGALMICLFVAMTALEAPWANAVEQFGEVHFPIACHAGVQKKFDLALAMLHTFSFPAAAKTFTAVSQEDPECAMAYWGLAATAIGSLYGGRPGPMALQGEIAVAKARAIGGKTSRDRDYIATIEVFYRGADEIDYATRRHAYANALERLHRKYPDDREAEIFYAYALSALGAPTDQTFAYQLKGAAILEKLLVELPNHPGVIHYLLHAYDNTRIRFAGLSGRPSVGQSRTFFAACAAISRSHLRSNGSVARIDRDQPRRRGRRRSVLQTARHGFSCTQLLANWARRSSRARY